MPQQFIVDQSRTFQAVAFLSSEPRIEFGTRDKQEATKDGLPRWDVQVIAAFRDNFGKVNNEVLKIGIAARQDPGDGLAMYTPVVLDNFTVGVIEKTARDDRSKVIGHTIWFRCDAVRSTAAVPSRKPE